MLDKKADLAGPGIGDYEELEKILPQDYSSLLSVRDTQKAIFLAKNFIEDHLCKALNLMMVTVPLIVDTESGVNDLLDRDGSRTPIQFHIANDRDKHPLEAQIVQAATKWKRVALKRFEMRAGEGLCTDMRAVRKDYFLDHDHSAYLDQWDWEKVIHFYEHDLDFLKQTVNAIWKVIVDAEEFLQEEFPALKNALYPNLPRKLTFLHAEDVLDMYPDLPRKQRETRLLDECPGVFLIGIGWTLKDGYPHEMRAADYDDWCTETRSIDGRPCHGLNGDILVWNHVTRRRHELSSMGIRVNAEALQKQLRITGQTDFLRYPYHQAIVRHELPLSIGGGIGQSPTLMLLLRKAHPGEVTVRVWPKILKEICTHRTFTSSNRHPGIGNLCILPPMSTSRRRFLKTACAMAPAIVGATDKSGSKAPVVGTGNHTYEAIHDWGELPAGIKYGNTHGVVEDSHGHIYVHHTVNAASESSDSMVVFDAQGKFVKSWGKDFKGGAHGLHIQKEGSTEFLYLCDTARGIVMKATLDGEKVYQFGYPDQSDAYKPGPDGKKPKYSPTNLAIAPNGDLYVGDGYGSSYINQYNNKGEYIRTFGGKGKEAGQLDCPHGIIVDRRGGNPILTVADRGNARIQRFTLDGKHIDFVSGTAMPCHFNFFKNGDVVVPDLGARVTLLDKNNQVIEHLGDDSESKWRETRKLSRDHFTPGKFVAPHGACFDHKGNIFVVEWVEVGRVTKLRRV